MLTTASCWRACTRCFCFASPFNFAFTWAMGITMHINSCPVKCSQNVAPSDQYVRAYRRTRPKHCSRFERSIRSQILRSRTVAQLLCNSVEGIGKHYTLPRIELTGVVLDPSLPVAAGLDRQPLLNL